MAEHKNIVVVGAGYGGITAALRLARLFRKHSEYSIHLVDRNPYHTLKTQLHEAAVHRKEVTIPIDRIIRKKSIHFHLGEVTNLDITNKTLFVNECSLPYYIVVLALGSLANFYSIPGLQEYSFPLQTAEDAERLYAHIRKLCENAKNEADPQQRKQYLRYIIGGGGLSGVEFAAELAEYLEDCNHRAGFERPEFEIILVEAMDTILPTLDASLRERITAKLKEKNVTILTNTRVLACTATSVTLSPNTILPTHTVVWTGGIRITNMPQESKITTGPLGRIVVDKYLRSIDSPYIYAIGDNALALNPTTGKPVPAAAQFALQQGRLVAHNIYVDCIGGTKREYHPKVLGEVVSLGKHLAVGWLAVPPLGKIRFLGFIGRLLKAAVTEKHIVLLRKESRNWITY
ncbi:MAG: NAD(P)/FAD-dependent oxidoreductase [Bacteroidetes bacterium]|nr:NAD(P)/FAD-dependent oxidoreductase [Bacteroidota bacterium]